jgi:hypothetical protein
MSAYDKQVRVAPGVPMHYVPSIIASLKDAQVNVERTRRHGVSGSIVVGIRHTLTHRLYVVVYETRTAYVIAYPRLTEEAV